MSFQTSVESIELERMDSVGYRNFGNYPDDPTKEKVTSDTIREELSHSPFPTSEEELLIARELPDSNIGALIEQANTINFWGILTTSSNVSGVLIQTNLESKLVVVFNDNGLIRFAFLEGRYAAFAMKYTMFLRFRNTPLWTILRNTLSE